MPRGNRTAGVPRGGRRGRPRGAGLRDDRQRRETGPPELDAAVLDALGMENTGTPGQRRAAITRRARRR